MSYSLRLNKREKVALAQTFPICLIVQKRHLLVVAGYLSTDVLFLTPWGRGWKLRNFFFQKYIFQLLIVAMVTDLRSYADPLSLVDRRFTDAFLRDMITLSYERLSERLALTIKERARAV